MSRPFLLICGPRRASLGRAVLLGLLPLAACSSSTASNDTTAPPGSDGGSSTTPPGSDGGATTPPPPPEVGLRLTSTAVTLDPSGEQYLCWSVPVATALQVVSTQVTVPKTGVHHYAVFTSKDPMPASASAYDCSAMKSSWTLVAGGGLGTPGLNLPDGTALQVPGGAQAILQLHVLNPGAAAVTITPVTIDLIGSTATNLSPAGVLVTGSVAIDIPAHATSATVHGGCTLSAPLANVFAVFPHMHTLGTHVNVSLTKSGGAPATLVDQAWDFGSQGVYPATASAAAGDRVDVTCTYSNPGNTPVSFGESTHDEMCFGVLYYWPAAKSETMCIQ